MVIRPFVFLCGAMVLLGQSLEAQAHKSRIECTLVGTYAEGKKAGPRSTALTKSQIEKRLNKLQKNKRLSPAIRRKEIRALRQALALCPTKTAPVPTPEAAPPEVVPPEVVASRYSTCFDGIDNDSDGVIDANDFDCSGPNQSEAAGLVPSMQKDHKGFTVVHPSPDSLIVHVSTSGSDAHSNPTELTPFRTLRRAHDFVRARQALTGTPDLILLKRGDVWVNEMIGDEYGQFSLSGRSATEPLVVSSYGSSPQRPRIDNTNGGGIIMTLGVPTRNVVLMGLELRQIDRQWFEGGTAIRILSESSDVLAEDLKISGFGGAFAVQQYVGPISRFSLRRSVISDQWSNLGHAQGMYTSGVDGLLLEDNVWVRNGWRPGAVVVPLVSAAWDPQTRILSQSGAAWAGPGTSYESVQADDTIEIIEGLITTSAITSSQAMNSVYEFSGGSELSAQDGAYVNRLVKLIQGQSTQLKRVVSYDGANRRFRVEGGFDAVPSASDQFEIHVAALARVEAIVSPHAIRLAPGTLGDVPVTGVKSGEGFRPTIYNRSMYLSSGTGNTRVIGNVDVLGASGGIQARRGCSDCSRNVMIEAPASISLGHAGNQLGSQVSGVVRQNLILGARDVNANHPLGWGITVTGSTRYRTVGGESVRECATSASDILVQDNIIAHNRSATGNLRALVTGPCVVDTQFDSNLVYDWSTASGAGAAISPDPTIFGIRAISYTNNQFQQPRGGRAVAIDTTPAILMDAFIFRDNRIWSGPNDYPMYAFNTPLNFSEWVERTGYGQDMFYQVEYPAPNRNVDTYMTHLGIGGGIEMYVDNLLGQSKVGWDERFSADAINNYVREGFGQGPVTR